MKPNQIFPGDHVCLKLGIRSIINDKRITLMRGDILKVSFVTKTEILFDFVYEGKHREHSFPIDEVELSASPEAREIQIGDRVLVKRNNVGATAQVGEAVTVLSLKPHPHHGHGTRQDKLGSLIWFQPIGESMGLHYIPIEDVEFVGVDAIWHLKNLKDNALTF